MLMLETISFFFFFSFDISQIEQKRTEKKTHEMKQYKVSYNKFSNFFFLLSVPTNKKIRYVWCSLANNCLLFRCSTESRRQKAKESEQKSQRRI